MTKIFITGATGYIGGDALHALVAAHPEYEIKALVRTSDKGAEIAKKYPKVKLAYGNLDSAELLEEESKAANIVLHCASADHLPAVTAIVKGLTSPSRANNPGYLIHLSGTGVLMFEDIQAKTFGQQLSTKVFDDLENVAEVTISIPDSAPHRTVEKAVIKAGTELSDRLKTALVCPPCIYGEGRGPDNVRSIQIPGLVKVILEKGHGVKVNEGKTYWNTVHVHDLSALFVLLVEEAAAGGSTAEWPGKPATWGAEGYYFAEDGELIWGEISQKIADEAEKLGYLKTKEVKSITPEEANGAAGLPGHVLWGANSRSKAKRAREILKWKPTGAKVEDTLKDVIEVEAKALGLKVGHAAVAAGES